MNEFVKIAGLKMANLDVGQGLNSNARFRALIYTHEIAFEQKAKYLAPAIG